MADGTNINLGGGAVGGNSAISALANFGQTIVKQLEDPDIRRALYSVGTQLDPQGVGGILGRAGMGLMESRQTGDILADEAQAQLTGATGQAPTTGMQDAVSGAGGPPAAMTGVATPATQLGTIGSLGTLDDLVNQIIGE